MLSKLILVVLGIIVAVVLYTRFSASPIQKADAHQLVAEGATLLDVRSPQEFASGHIEGAINIPVQELGRRVDELGDPSGQIVVYCQSGVRSASAKRLLESRGFANVYDLGGIARW
jgi:rhodanese-related sulfurtransferase